MNRTKRSTFFLSPSTGTPPHRQTEIQPQGTVSPSKLPDAERVKVFVRVRPTQGGVETPGALRLLPGGTRLLLRREADFCSEFAFDGILDPSANQADVYTIAAKPAVADVLRGFNATVLAYGQTGSGKTHTLSNLQQDAIGLVPRAISEIFAAIALENPDGCSYTVSMSYLQIYCEMIQDLLRPESGDNLPIRETEEGLRVVGLQSLEVRSVEECLQLLQLGARNRAVAFTALNAHSSRSHAVLMLTVTKRSLGNHENAVLQAHKGKIQVGKLFMVDLAGSERLKKSKSTGQRATEAKSINLSLTTLGMCVSACATGQATHIPYRDSKLTRLLQDSLGGNARSTMVVAICDAVEHADETLQSLQFGTRAMRVITHARINETTLYEDGNNNRKIGISGSEREDTAALARTLLEKESQLEAMHAQLQAQEERSRQVAKALRLEREEAEARASALEVQHAAALGEHSARLEDVRRRAEDAETRLEEQSTLWSREKEELHRELDELTVELAQAQGRAAAAERQRATDLEAVDEQRERELANIVNEWQARLAAQIQVHEAEMAVRAAAAVEAQQRWTIEKDAMEQRHACEMAEKDALQDLLHVENSTISAKLASAREEILQAAAARQASDAEITTLRNAFEGVQEELERVNQNKQHLEHKLEVAQAESADLRGHVHEMAAKLRAARGRAHEAEKEAATAKDAYRKLQLSLRKDKELNEAATTIQRAFRRYRVRVLESARSQGFAALSEAQHALGSLAAQHADLEARRDSNLAFAGQTLMAESLGALHDTVEELVVAFLLPNRDLRAVQRYKQKSGVAGGSTHGGSVRLGSRADLIPAVREAFGL